MIDDELVPSALELSSTLTLFNKLLSRDYYSNFVYVLLALVVPKLIIPPNATRFVWLKPSPNESPPLSESPTDCLVPVRSTEPLQPSPHLHFLPYLPPFSSINLSTASWECWHVL